MGLTQNILNKPNTSSFFSVAVNLFQLNDNSLPLMFIKLMMHDLLYNHILKFILCF